MGARRRLPWPGALRRSLLTPGRILPADKEGKVVERGSGNPMSFEKKIVELLA